MSINLKDTNYLLNNNLIKLTKAGKPWRAGRGYRKDWAKLIGKEVLLHNKPYILTNRVKKEGKWYLVYTDRTNSYTELQTKALHNKNMAKDTIIEAVKRVIAGLLTAPKELIDALVEQADTFVKFYNYKIYQNPANYTKKGTLRKSVEKNKLIETWDNYLLGLDDVYYSRMVNSTKKLFNNKIWYLMDVCDLGWKSSKELYRQLIQYYHPDHYHKYFPTECFKAIQWLKRAI